MAIGKGGRFGAPTSRATAEYGRQGPQNTGYTRYNEYNYKFGGSTLGMNVQEGKDGLNLVFRGWQQEFKERFSNMCDG